MTPMLVLEPELGLSGWLGPGPCEEVGSVSVAVPVEDDGAAVSSLESEVPVWCSPRS